MGIHEPAINTIIMLIAAGGCITWEAAVDSEELVKTKRGSNHGVRHRASSLTVDERSWRPLGSGSHKRRREEEAKVLGVIARNGAGNTTILGFGDRYLERDRRDAVGTGH